MNTVRTFPVPDGVVGERVDAALARVLGISRSVAAQIADDGGVLVNGRPVGKGDRLVSDAMVEVTLPDPNAPSPLAVKPEPVAGMKIMYDDDDVVVIDKPVGVAAHPAVSWEGPTVVGALAAAGYRISTSGAAERQGIVHRLDAGTSGLMVVAKSEYAYSVMKRAFRERTVEKVYHTLVQGHPEPTRGTIDAPIGRHPKSEFKFAVMPEGKRSITHYEVLEMLPAASLVEVHLETGRTHQIRVHFSAMRHPCVGDLMYGADPKLTKKVGLTRQWLHAVRLGFTHPSSGQWIQVESEYPDDLAHALDVLRSPYA
ncbi:RluA family pseudouridine synthase [Timonella senegalensis]|uniref:RluA family pseudouridine synthase n=3 Tax=Timonella senegalensis TaxID=1465825 RepID=UPI0028AB86A3|nr:RluA family pseudouridine synthase [Timonella senegalensis]